VQEALSTDGFTASHAVAAATESWASVRDQARIVLRPAASPSTMGGSSRVARVHGSMFEQPRETPAEPGVRSDL
jgi:hypothetical protein